MKKNLALFSVALLSISSAFGMGSHFSGEKMAQVNNYSSYDIDDVRIKVKLTGEDGSVKGSVHTGSLPAGQTAYVDLLDATQKRGGQIVDQIEKIRTVEIFKVQPKMCSLQGGSSEKCRSRFKPANKNQRSFTITDQTEEVYKTGRKDPLKQREKKQKEDISAPERRILQIK